jgi:hypothetical protein
MISTTLDPNWKKTKMDKSIALNTKAPMLSPFSGGVADFETAQRMAKSLAESDIVPAIYKGKLSNCLVALEVAHRTGSSVLAVMQNLNIIQGKPSWSAQYIIGAINSSGRFSTLRFDVTPGAEVTMQGFTFKNLICIAYATDNHTGDVVSGPPVSIEMAVLEGWYGKSGSKWKTMPDLMLRYRAATFFGRLFCPEILLGMKSEDEVRDVTPEQAAPAVWESLNAKIRQRKEDGEET